MLLFYIRHGDPVYDPDELTPLGHRQAESVARRLALFGVDEVYSSSSTRAMQTAQPTCELLHKELITLDFLNENKLKGLHLGTEAKITGFGRTLSMGTCWHAATCASWGTNGTGIPS